MHGRCKLKDNIRSYLASAVNVIHTGVLGVSITGWYWWPVNTLIWYMAALMGILLQWSFLDKRCLLTDLEWWLRYQRRWEPDEGSGFLFVLADKLGVPWTERANQMVPRVGIYICIGLAALRFSAHK